MGNSSVEENYGWKAKSYLGHCKQEDCVICKEEVKDVS